MANRYINLGENRWRGRWISKQDLVEYMRCKYRVYLSYTKGISIMDMKETLLLQLLIEKGLEFESEVFQDIKPLKVQTIEAIEPLKKESLFIQVPQIFRNHKLGIQGIPDLINTDKGKFLPIEIKGHKAVTEMDKLELAFYWLLLDPLRKRRVKPRGYIILNTEDVVEVSLTKDHLFEVEILVDDLRQILKKGTRPSLSRECKGCSLEKDCRDEVLRSGGLTIIYNIAHKREKQFQSIGINNILDLMKIDEDKLNDELISRFGNTPGVEEISRMKCHAFSLRSGKPVFWGDSNTLNKLKSQSLLILDLEYDVERLIWLVGIGIRKRNRIAYRQFFAEKVNLAEEKRLLESLIQEVSKHHNYLLVTYGISADIPQLKKAWFRQGYTYDELDELMKNHLDLCYFLQSSFRLPIASFSLSNMEDYLDISRHSKISDGLEALTLYKRYLRTRDKTLKQELLDYNKDDIYSTLSVIDGIARLAADSLIV